MFAILGLIIWGRWLGVSRVLAVHRCASRRSSLAAALDTDDGGDGVGVIFGIGISDADVDVLVCVRER